MACPRCCLLPVPRRRRHGVSARSFFEPSFIARGCFARVGNRWIHNVSFHVFKLWASTQRGGAEAIEGRRATRGRSVPLPQAVAVQPREIINNAVTVFPRPRPHRRLGRAVDQSSLQASTYKNVPAPSCSVRKSHCLPCVACLAGDAMLLADVLCFCFCASCRRLLRQWHGAHRLHPQRPMRRS